MSVEKKIMIDIEQVRKVNPLVHNITNYVVMNQTANALLAIGASPIMAHAEQELEDLIKICSSLVLNIGTLDSNLVNSIMKAIKHAKNYNKPIIIDPVGTGASDFRTNVAKNILEQAKSNFVVKANPSEILALDNKGINSKGVDSTSTVEEAINSAYILSNKYNSVFIISGPTDVIIFNDKMVKLTNGSKMLQFITGAGCTATSLVGAFCGTFSDKFYASISAMAAISIAAEIAEANSKGPGSFSFNLYDALFNLTNKEINERINISE